MYGPVDRGYGGYDSKQYKPFKQRGGCLLIWLILTIGGSILAFLWVISGAPQRMIAELGLQGTPDYPPWFWPYSAFSNLVIVACGIGIWMWRRWGFYGYLAITLIGVAILYAVGAGSIVGLIGVAVTFAIAWFVVSPYWEDMD